MNDRCAFADDGALLAALRRQDTAAFDYLVRTYRRRLLTVARRILTNEEDAQDAVQNTFLAVFRAIGAFERDAKLSTWLHSIVLNAALMILRAKRRRPEHLHDPFVLERLQDQQFTTRSEALSPSPESFLLRRETCTFVQSCLTNLSAKSRTVLLLRELEGFNTWEAARCLNVSPNAVKIRLCRARKLFRQVVLSRLVERESEPATI